MNTKILRVCVCLIALLGITGIFVQMVGADMWNSEKQDGETIKPIDQLMAKQLYGPLKLVEPHEIEVNKGLSYYEDNKYRYSVQEDGTILSIIRLESPAAPPKSLSKNQAIAVAEEMLRNIIPKFDGYSFKVSAEQFDDNDTPWRIFYNLVNEKGIIFGGIRVFIDLDGEVRMLCSDISSEEFTKDFLHKDLVDEDQAIAIAFQALEKWAEEQNWEYDLAERESHTIAASQNYYSDLASICWTVQISNVKKVINPEKVQHQSFIITINAHTGEVLCLSPSR